MGNVTRSRIDLRDALDFVAIPIATLSGFLDSSLLVPVIIICALLVSSVIRHGDLYQQAWKMQARPAIFFGVGHSLLAAIVAVGAAVVLGHVVKWIFW